jgi:hypothetical protein
LNFLLVGFKLESVQTVFIPLQRVWVHFPSRDLNGNVSRLQRSQEIKFFFYAGLRISQVTFLLFNWVIDDLVLES